MPLTPRERYLRDPQFKHLVDSMRVSIESALFTPTEIREAAILAQTMYEERRPPEPPNTMVGEYRTRG